MATLIPSYGTCAGRMTPGERRFAQRLEAKLEGDYLCWYDVPVGPTNCHPDFIVLHPQRGLLILEVKDWKPDTIQSITKSDAAILTPQGLKHVLNPLEQARQYAHAVVGVLARDKQLTLSSGKMEGRLTFPWAYGVVLANISRRTFESSGLAEVIEPQRVICQDEMTESVEMEAFQQRLWEMFSVRFPGNLTLPQLDRIRWHLFPEIRLPNMQEGLFKKEELEAVEIPDLMRVMDLQQEQLARSLGEGHRVIHGVAGSGKTLILGYRAEQLAKVCAKPILVLCYNKTLAGRLVHWMASKGVADKVHVRTFHSWCRSQLSTYNVNFANHQEDKNALMAEMVQAVIRAVERGQIPPAQYEAVLIDEGHDFRPEWLKLVVQMVDPHSNSLLVLYDDAQSIYEAGRQKNFSFKSVGIQAQGRTTILKVNYRNTQEILEFAAQFASELLKASDAGEDGIPRLVPISAGRHGKAPMVVKLPTLQAEGEWIAERLKEEHAKGTPWRDMAILYRHYEPICTTVRKELRKGGIPNTWKDDVSFGESQDTVKLLPFHSSKGLEYPIIVIPGAGLLPTPDKATEEDARLLYVAMTRATSQLIVTGAQNA
ncbi:3'-5' exonuclease [Sulfuritalea sp.]|uniref:DEAD/DEAH box helicase n=1 Tax=Sulfuritalea sp. TaxID=2480090 RepID=UPI0025D2B636|nr:3'-5' exonuclease [Sulfuritalea sp.]